MNTDLFIFIGFVLSISFLLIMFRVNTILCFLGLCLGIVLVQYIDFGGYVLVGLSGLYNVNNPGQGGKYLEPSFLWLAGHIALLLAPFVFAVALTIRSVRWSKYTIIYSLMSVSTVLVGSIITIMFLGSNRLSNFETRLSNSILQDLLFIPLALGAVFFLAILLKRSKLLQKRNDRSPLETSHA